MATDIAFCIGCLLGSLVSGVTGYLILRFTRTQTN
jgi:Na+/H+ antiporter NhaA